MKYTEEQKQQLKRKNIPYLPRHNRHIPRVTTKDGFYIIESKMNQ